MKIAWRIHRLLSKSVLAFISGFAYSLRRQHDQHMMTTPPIKTFLSETADAPVAIPCRTWHIGGHRMNGDGGALVARRMR